MFVRPPERGLLTRAFTILELMFHGAARSVRQSHRNALWAILLSILQTVLMAGAFYLLFLLIPAFRATMLHGDMILFLMSGVMMFMVHVKAMAAVIGAEGPSSGMMQHMPMNTIVAIGAAALGALYTQVMAMAAILAVYHVGWGNVSLEQPVPAILMLILAWASGCAVGMVVRPIKPFLPQVASVLQQVYSRLNMILSGKMFVANVMAANIIALFAWNPLFHIIDQCRGFVFVNYVPLKSNLAYPLAVTGVLFMIGLMGEFVIRNRVSASLGAGR